jgi:hypothetical protein
LILFLKRHLGFSLLFRIRVGMRWEWVELTFLRK